MNDAYASVRAACDQWFEGMKPLMAIMVDFHSSCITAGLPPAVADALTIRMADLFIPLPTP